MSKILGRSLSAIVFFLVIVGGPLHASAAQERRSCFYDRVYCKARTDRIAMVRGPTVKVKNCELGAASNEAMARLRNVCGGNCLPPISCLALDDTDFETEIGYTPR